MPRQNRVLPTGEIVALPVRGTMTGNRGCLHDDQGHIRRRWTTRAWIACELEWRGIRRPLMAPGRWTELFFLDEAVALAAGHRPCGYCRRADYRAFVAAWAQQTGRPPRAPEMDAALHAARLGPRPMVSAQDLPDGAFVMLPEGPALRLGAGLLAFAPQGYGAALPCPEADVPLLTPQPVIAVLRAGYRPRLHPSASPDRLPGAA